MCKHLNVFVNVLGDVRCENCMQIWVQKEENCECRNSKGACWATSIDICTCVCHKTVKKEEKCCDCNFALNMMIPCGCDCHKAVGKDDCTYKETPDTFKEDENHAPECPERYGRRCTSPDTCPCRCHPAGYFTKADEREWRKELLDFLSATMIMPNPHETGNQMIKMLRNKYL